MGLMVRDDPLGSLVACEEERGTLTRAHEAKAGPAKKGGGKCRSGSCPNHLFMSQMTFLFHFPCPEESREPPKQNGFI